MAFWGFNDDTGSPLRLGSGSSVRLMTDEGGVTGEPVLFTPAQNGVVDLLEASCLNDQGADDTMTMTIYEITGTGPVTATQVGQSSVVVLATDTTKAWRGQSVNIPLDAGKTYALMLDSNAGRITFYQQTPTNASDFQSGTTTPPASFTSTGKLNEIYAIRANFEASGPSLDTPTSIQGDGTAIAYTGNQISLTAPMRAKVSHNTLPIAYEVELPTTNTDSSSGTFDWSAGFDAVISDGMTKDVVYYTGGDWNVTLSILDETNTFDLDLNITHLVKSGAFVFEFSKAQYQNTGNGLLKDQQSLIGDSDQLYFESDQVVGFTPSPLTLDFNDVLHPLPASVGGDSGTFAGDLTYAWANTNANKVARGIYSATPYGFGGLYVNSFLIGGAPSGPVDGNNPPNNHTIGFNTVDSFPESIGADGAFKWVMNDAKDTGRCFLQYNLAANNPDWQVGEIYEFTVQVTSDTTTVAAGTSAVSGLTINNITTTAIAGQTTELKIEITVDSLGYTGQLRYGVGTTTNRSISTLMQYGFIISTARHFSKPPTNT